MRPACLILFLVLAQPAVAGAPQPLKAAAPGMYAGRWYQIGQIVRTNNHPCPGGVEDFAPNAKGALTVTLSCHPKTGPGRQIKAKVQIVPGSGAAKFRMSFFGGLIHQEYWLLDYAPDQSWALMATPGGNYLWLIARRPVLDPAVRASALTSVKALGYDPRRLAPLQ